MPALVDSGDEDSVLPGFTSVLVILELLRVALLRLNKGIRECHHLVRVSTMSFTGFFIKREGFLRYAQHGLAQR